MIIEENQLQLPRRERKKKNSFWSRSSFGAEFTKKIPIVGLVLVISIAFTTHQYTL